MPRFRLDRIAELSRQMLFTPGDTRVNQLVSAETLLHEIDPGKAYPLEFVIFRITGYRPKSISTELLTGLALQHDLGLLIEHASDTLDLNTSDEAEPVLSIDDVTEKFNVTSKTIQRWRRKGLPARRFVFPDAKKRVGFLLSSVERFVLAHQDQVVRGGNFSQLTDSEKVEIIRRARRLATMCRCCVNEICRRIARRMNRSPLTVLHTIKHHDQLNPQSAVFVKVVEEIPADDRIRVVRAFKHGVTIKSLAKRTCRPRSAIYRVLLDARIEKLTARKVRFIDDELFHQDSAAEQIDHLNRQPILSQEANREELRVPRDLPPYLAELYRNPLLTAAQERSLFLKFNFRKYQFVQSRRRFEPQFARARELNELEGHLRRANETKNCIIAANLRLVVSVARKHLRQGISLMELISDGNITLMRAVEGFDVNRGFKFSTYATLALMKGFARSVPQMLSDRAMVAHVKRETMQSEVAEVSRESFTENLTRRDEVAKLVSVLDHRERAVVLSRWGIERDQPSNYEQLSEQLGLTQQRIRNIEKLALEKLRAVASTLR